MLVNDYYGRGAIFCIDPALKTHSMPLGFFLYCFLFFHSYSSFITIRIEIKIGFPAKYDCQYPDFLWPNLKKIPCLFLTKSQKNPWPDRHTTKSATFFHNHLQKLAIFFWVIRFTFLDFFFLFAVVWWIS